MDDLARARMRAKLTDPQRVLKRLHLDLDWAQLRLSQLGDGDMIARHELRQTVVLIKHQINMVKTAIG